MEVHDLVVLELVLVEAHLLPMDLLEALRPLIRVGKELQTGETLGHVTVLIKG